MAERRSFAQIIVGSDKFYAMSLGAQCLYFHLGVGAYDKGIVYNARVMSRFLTGDEKAAEELLENKYLINTDDGHYQIVHWYENNGIGETAKKRNNYSYRKWRAEVLKRDGRCLNCGSTEKLVAHHIKPFAEFPEYRFDVNNGITLCDSCHKRLHGLERSDGEETDV